MSEEVERKFQMELARVALTDINSIFCVSAALDMERSAIEQDRVDYSNDIEAIGKAFIRRWKVANSNDPDKYRKLRKAFGEAQLIGVFESVAARIGWRLPPHADHEQVQLAGTPHDELVYKIKNVIDQLPRLISTENILWEVGLYGGCDDDLIQSISANNRGNINQAGRDLIQSILNSNTGGEKSKINTLQNVFDAAGKLNSFVGLLRKNGISPGEIEEVEEEAEITTGEERNNQLLPANSGQREREESLRHYDGLVVSTSQVGGAHRNFITREGTSDYSFVAANLQSPIAQSVTERFVNLHATERGATGGTVSSSQRQMGESGYETDPENGQQMVS